MMAPLGLYVHVPFCVAKCPYCDFYSQAGDAATMDAYCDTVLATLDGLSQNGVQQQADTLYFGGGTPSLLGAERLSTLIGRARKRFGLFSAEITVECNPGGEGVPDGLHNFFTALRAAGANRLSMGLQSALPAELAALGRRHTPEEVQCAVAYAREAGFENISLDVMLGIPKQTLKSAVESVEFCAALGATHVSAYLLKIEQGTPFAAHAASLCLPDDDAQADLYLRVVERLAELGYAQYEISNFAQAGYESRHNLKYWQRTDYIGIGPAAHSLTNGVRWYYPRSLQGFVANWQSVLLEATDTPAHLPEVAMIGEGYPTGQADSAHTAFAEYAMLYLRLTQGITRGGVLVHCPYAEAEFDALLTRARPLVAAGLVTLTRDSVSLTPQGFLLSNAVTLRLLGELLS